MATAPKKTATKTTKAVTAKPVAKVAKAVPAAKTAAAPSAGWFSRIPLWQKLVAAFAVVAVLIFAIVTMATSAPVKVSNEFLDDMQAGKATEAYALMSAAARSTVTTTEFDAVVAQVGPILNTKEKMKSKYVSAETGSAATANVVYEIDGTDGITYTLTINLTKDQGNWRVLNFESKHKQ